MLTTINLLNTKLACAHRIVTSYVVLPGCSSLIEQRGKTQLINACALICWRRPGQKRYFRGILQQLYNLEVETQQEDKEKSKRKSTFKQGAYDHDQNLPICVIFGIFCLYVLPRFLKAVGIVITNDKLLIPFVFTINVTLSTLNKIKFYVIL